MYIYMYTHTHTCIYETRFFFPLVFKWQQEWTTCKFATVLWKVRYYHIHLLPKAHHIECILLYIIIIITIITTVIINFLPFVSKPPPIEQIDILCQSNVDLLFTCK